MSAALIREREKTHGHWGDTARLATEFKAVLALAMGMRDDRGEKPLSPEQREALDMILTKVARIVAGDPNHADHWRDISGYALLGIAFDQEADSVGSYNAAIGAIGERVKAGQPVPTGGYFARQADTGVEVWKVICPRCKTHYREGERHACAAPVSVRPAALEQERASR